MIQPSDLTSSQIGIGVVVVLYAFDKVIAFVERISRVVNNKKNGTDSTAGAQSVDFWKREFDKVNVGIGKIIEVQAKTAESQQETAEILQRMAVYQEQEHQWSGHDRRSPRSHS